MNIVRGTKVFAFLVLLAGLAGLTGYAVGRQQPATNPSTAVAESPYALSIELIETERQVSTALKRLEKACVAEQAGTKSLADSRSDNLDELAWTKLATENREQVLRRIELDTASAGYRYARGRLQDIAARMQRNKGIVPVPDERSIPRLEFAIDQFRKGNAAKFVNNTAGLSVVFEDKGVTGG